MNDADSTLNDVLLKHLHSGVFDQRPLQDLINVVRAEYLKVAPKNQIPHKPHKEFLSGLEVEIKDRIHALTYGHFDIKSYNQKRKGL